MKTEIGILTIGALQITAMFTNHDGATLLPVVAVIGGIVGFRTRPVVETLLESVDPSLNRPGKAARRV